MVGKPVLNILMNNHVIANSIEYISRESNGHASVIYYLLKLLSIENTVANSYSLTR